jgi:hypothetical protein
MSDDNKRHTLQTRIRTAWLIWASMLSMLAVYILIARLWGGQIRTAAGSGASIIPLRTVFYMVALATFPLINFLRRKMVRYPSRRRWHHDRHIQTSRYDSYYLTIVTLSLALAESIGVWGFVLFILGDNLQTLYLFCGMSALAIVLYRPKADELEQLKGVKD